MEALEKWLERVYEAGGDRGTLDDLYDRWARDYDQHIWGSGNPYIAIAAGMVGKYVAEYHARILDAGCGTGNMAQVLSQMGYHNLEGLDPSSGMLAIAEGKGIYKKLHRLCLAEQIEIPAESYDAVVAAGVLTHGHAPPESLDGILKVTRAGGIVIFSLSEIASNEHGFAEKISELDTAGIWESIHRSALFRTYPFSDKEAHIKHWVYVYRKKG